MSFYSALTIFYPGCPPLLTVAELRRFYEGLWTLMGLEENNWGGVELQYGKSGSTAFDRTHQVKWDRSGTVGRLPWEDDREPENLDHETSAGMRKDWWPAPPADGKTVHRAHVSRGKLPRRAILDLWAAHPDHESSRDYARSFICPDSLSVGISPEYAMTLATETPEDEDECYGFLGLHFSGSGYFSWRPQPLDAYWQ